MNDDFRVYVYTCHRLGISSQEIHIELVTVRGDASPSSRTVSRWISNIRTDQFRLENRAGCGRPLSTTSTAKVQKIKTLITENCRLSCSDIEYILSIPKSCVHEVLTKHLHLGNVYAVWVPHNLSTSNKTARVNCCQKLIKLFNVKSFQYLCSNYLVHDESWFLWDKMEDRRVCLGKRAMKPTSVKSKLTKRKSMGLVAFTWKPMRFSASVLSCGTTIDANYMIEYHRETWKRFPDIKKEKIALKETLLQMGHARPHSAAES